MVRHLKGQIHEEQLTWSLQLGKEKAEGDLTPAYNFLKGDR